MFFFFFFSVIYRRLFISLYLVSVCVLFPFMSTGYTTLLSSVSFSILWCVFSSCVFITSLVLAVATQHPLIQYIYLFRHEIFSSLKVTSELCKITQGRFNSMKNCKTSNEKKKSSRFFSLQIF